MLWSESGIWSDFNKLCLKKAKERSIFGKPQKFFLNIGKDKVKCETLHKINLRQGWGSILSLETSRVDTLKISQTVWKSCQLQT